MQRLRQLERPFAMSIELGNAPVSKSLARIIEESPNLETKACRIGRVKLATLFDALKKRKHPIELAVWGVNDLSVNEWQSFATLKNIRLIEGADGASLRIFENGVATSRDGSRSRSIGNARSRAIGLCNWIDCHHRIAHPSCVQSSPQMFETCRLITFVRCSKVPFSQSK